MNLRGTPFENRRTGFPPPRNLNRKNMKKTLFAALTAILCLCLAGCRDISGIKVTSCKMTSISPSGLRSLDGVVTVGIHNPTTGFQVTQTSGKVYHKGNELVDFTVDDFEVNAKSDKEYDISGHASLASGASLLTVLALARDLKTEEYTVDIATVVKAKGLNKTIKRSGIPLNRIIEAAK